MKFGNKKAPPKKKVEAKGKLKGPPPTYQRFVARYPKLGEAWDLVHEASTDGPLTERERLLVKLAVAAGALREGAVGSAARKGRAGGLSEDDLAQTIALATSVIGFPATVAVFSWVEPKED